MYQQFNTLTGTYGPVFTTQDTSTLSNALNSANNPSSSMVDTGTAAGAGIGSAIGGIINGVTGIIGTAMTNSANKQIAQENLEYQKEVQEYNKALQQEIFRREDNAIQRRALDLEKAGLSKTLAAGQGANAGEVVALNPLNNQHRPDYAGYSQAVQATLDYLLNARRTSAEAAYFDSQARLIKEKERGERITNDINEAYGMQNAGAEYQLTLGKLSELNQNLENLKTTNSLNRANIFRVLSEAGVNQSTISNLEARTRNVDADTALKIVQTTLAQENVTDAKFWNEANYSNKLYYDMFGVPINKSGQPITTFDGAHLSIPSLFGLGYTHKGYENMSNFPSSAEIKQMATFSTQAQFVDWLQERGVELPVINALVKSNKNYFKESYKNNPRPVTIDKVK